MRKGGAGLDLPMAIALLVAGEVLRPPEVAGMAFLGELGSFVLKKRPDFDPRNYGFEKLLPLIRSLQSFEIDERETGRRNVKLVYVRARNR